MLLVFDTTAILVRCFYSGAGLPGCMNAMKRILNLWRPKYACSVQDPAGCPTWRRLFRADYKRGRKDTPMDLWRMIEDMPVLANRDLGVKSVSVNFYEADDVIASLAFDAAVQHNQAVGIVGSDKDFFQLLTLPGVRLLNPFGRSRTGPESVTSAEDVEKKLGVPIDAVEAFYSLTGDSSDHIPGLPGVGPVKARKMLEKSRFRLELVLEQLREDERQLVMDANHLIRLRTNVPGLPALDDLSVRA